MPFQSDKQRRFMYAKHPAIAKRWTAEAKASGRPAVSPTKVPAMNALATARKSDKPTPGDKPDSRAAAFKAKMAPRFGGKKNELAAKIASRKKKTK